MYNVLLTSIGATGAQCYIKALSPDNFKIIGCNASSDTPFKGRVGNFYKIPLAEDPDFLNSLYKIIENEKIDLFVPIMESELYRVKSELGESRAKVLGSKTEVLDTFQNKKRTYKFFKDKDIPYPELYSSDNKKFPLILKPEKGMGSVGIYICKNDEEFDFYSKKINLEAYLIQEFIEGDEYSIDCFLDKDSNVLATIPRKRLRIKGGLCSKTKTVEDSGLISDVRRLLSTSGIVGPCNVQAIKRDGKNHFTEVNARIGGTFIASVRAGLEFNQYVLDFMENRNSKPLERYEKDLVMTRYWEEVYENEPLS